MPQLCREFISREMQLFIPLSQVNEWAKLTSKTHSYINCSRANFYYILCSPWDKVLPNACRVTEFTNSTEMQERAKQNDLYCLPSPLVMATQRLRTIVSGNICSWCYERGFENCYSWATLPVGRFPLFKDQVEMWSLQTNRSILSGSAQSKNMFSTCKRFPFRVGTFFVNSTLLLSLITRLSGQNTKHCSVPHLVILYFHFGT